MAWQSYTSNNWQAFSVDPNIQPTYIFIFVRQFQVLHFHSSRCMFATPFISLASQLTSCMISIRKRSTVMTTRGRRLVLNVEQHGAVSCEELAECCQDDTAVQRHCRSEIVDQWTVTFAAAAFTRLQRPQSIQLHHSYNSRTVFIQNTGCAYYEDNGNFS